MSCNCKKKMVLEDTYGTKEEESIYQKSIRFFWRIVMFALMLVMACVLVPILIFVIIFQIAFKNNIKVTLPNFLGKYLK